MPAMWVLRNKAGEEVKSGATLTSRNGNTTGTLTDATPPHKESSSGYVYVRENGASYTRPLYAHVFDLKWTWAGEGNPWR